MNNPEYLEQLKKIVLPAFNETLYMVFFSSLFSVILGIFFGIVLYVTEKDGILENKVLNRILGIIINIGRSVPFVILMIAVFPLSKFIVGTTLGSKAAIVPLTVAAIPFVARMIEACLKEIDKGVIEASISMGATEWQIIYKVLIPESISSIISTITTTIISIIGYSAMAGTIGGGGLGSIAITYGYQRYRDDILIISVVLMVILVQIVQTIGNILGKKLNKK
ncbi:methionine ABC transporter permease [uncultured Tyzzerella sp.]|uniref:methionine ABC transporter permease n=1 Tax=uncultured Tyzzerella sp. TaxID=2321398 RepID=UPI00294249E5|nr:methionine ABC transporter permease [uncultured Tyzzerella sp.]